jgi:predicted Rossmann fold flavoprotein
VDGHLKIVVVGGGAAGFFAAIAAKQAYPHASLVLHERTNQVLSKVRISGGGRCNVTHACFDPKELVKNYPRGNKELLGPFHKFQATNTVEWFLERGVKLKTEKDGRMFPVTDSSETIIHCLLSETKRLGIEIRRQSKFTFNDFNGDRLILATGSSKTGWEIAQSLGHTIQPPVPSLFTFNIPHFSLESAAGISVDSAHLTLENSPFSQKGPLLITHWGFSGPAALKLSAFGARFLFEKNYETSLLIDWLPQFSIDELFSLLTLENKTKKLKNFRSIPLPKRLWNLLIGKDPSTLGSLSQSSLRKLCEKLKSDRYQIKGKTTNKEEFVTCGGVTLSEVNFKTMESKIHQGLYFCGEILDIDGITGGFNFQNAWTTGWIAGTA